MRNFFYLTLILLLMTTLQAISQENDDSVKVTVTNVGDIINSGYDEFAPIISADGYMMIFTSSRPIGKNAMAKKLLPGNENIYVSYYDDYTWKWSEPKILSESVNQPEKNNSAISLSNDGQRLLIFRGDPDGNIYESVLKGDEWSEPVKLPEPINSKRHESSASISPDGRTIYFVSNRNGGQGKLDIWLCHQDNMGTWGKAENLGPDINTPDNEEGVFIHPDGKTLYFSSKGHNSIGGFDVFKTVLEDGKWSIPVSLGNLINTPDDDLFFSITADGKTGYYSTGFSAKIDSTQLKAASETTDSLIKAIKEAQILLGQQVQRVRRAQLVLYNLQEDQAQQVIKETQTQLVEQAKEVQQVIEEAQALLVLKSVLVQNTGSNATTGTSSDTISANLSSANKNSGSLTADLGRVGFGGKDIYEISFKNKKNESGLTLFKGLVIDFDSHDPVGTDIEISDNDKNEIIANIQSNSVTGKYLVSLPAGKNYGIAVKKKGYLFYSENFNIPDSAAYKEINKNIELQKFTVGNTIVLKNVFYDSGKATLKPESVSEINQLVQLMNLNIDIKIEIASYTDNIGKKESNIALSQARSQSVADFLFSAGISKDQVVAKGYGGAKPIASNETEEGRKLNRRTEIKILEQ